MPVLLGAPWLTSPASPATSSRTRPRSNPLKRFFMTSTQTLPHFHLADSRELRHFISATPMEPVPTMGVTVPFGATILLVTLGEISAPSTARICTLDTVSRAPYIPVFDQALFVVCANQVLGGLSVDLQKPGSLVVTALNSWWPDGQIFRSTDSGATWKKIWHWGNYPERILNYTQRTPKVREQSSMAWTRESTR